MLASTLTVKGQATIPAEVRKALLLHPGDRVIFKITDNKAIIAKAEPFDHHYYASLSSTLSEWNSKDDDDAYHNL